MTQWGAEYCRKLINVKRILTVGIVMVTLLLCGCTNPFKDPLSVVLTTGFEEDELFRINGYSCFKPELMVYLTNIQNQYQNVYGSDIWNAGNLEESLEDKVKNTAIAQIAQIKTMNLMAENYGIALSEEDEKKALEAAAIYYDSLNTTEIEQMGINRELIESLYKEYALAQDVYEYMIKDINPEISDDEARTITVKHILIKTYALDGTGKKIEYTSKTKLDAYNLACEIDKRAKEGEDFDELIRLYSEDDKSTYSFGKGELDEAFEKAAFDLGNSEVSDVVETSYGYHIIMCVNTFDKDETDANKLEIVKQRKEEVFEQEYNTFVESLTRELNEEVWDSVHFISDENVTTDTFFDVYTEVFE